jgi:hypothetical protein
MGSYDAILCEGGRTTAVSLVGTHHGPGDALGHLLVVPLGNDSLGVWINTTTGAGSQIPIKGNDVLYNQSLPRSSMTLGYQYALPGTNAGEHLYGVTTITWVVSLEYR